MTDSRVDIMLGQLGGVGRARVARVDGVDTLELPFSGDGGVIDNRGVARFKATMSEVGGTYTYDWSIDPEGGAAWAVTNFSPNLPCSRVAGEEEDIDMVLALAASDSSLHTERRMLTLRARRTDSDAVGPFVSFFQIPIRGYPR